MCDRFVQTPIGNADTLGFPKLVGDLMSIPEMCNLAHTPRASVVPDHGTGP